MEYYFENVYTDSEEMIQEINAKIGTRKIRRWIWVYLAIAVFYLLFFLPGVDSYPGSFSLCVLAISYGFCVCRFTEQKNISKK